MKNTKESFEDSGDCLVRTNMSIIDKFLESYKHRLKDDRRFDFDQSAFSPTELDDSFMFHYRQQPTTGFTDSTDSKMVSSNMPEIKVQAINKGMDFSKHPPPCQKYLSNVNIDPPPQTTPEMKIKSPGTDDGFKGEAAKCGTSIIRVASQMISGKVVQGFFVEKDKCEKDEQPVNYDLAKRRGSKSLPASPLVSPTTSPKTQRRAINKYFTGAFTDVDKTRGSWILSNLLARRDMSRSVGHISEETKEELDRASSNISIEDGHMGKKSPVYRAKPSELREMNFWSPTSM